VLTLYVHEDSFKLVTLFWDVLRYYTRDRATQLDTLVVLEMLKSEALPLRESLQNLGILWEAFVVARNEITQPANTD